mmetsp:Transcript_37931/g.55708  ORF Transcript_37931/g.55708 Transcript_37931/m.55708 type:complete len:98 (+) Transcript_37931:72-365(+)
MARESTLKSEDINAVLQGVCRVQGVAWCCSVLRESTSKSQRNNAFSGQQLLWQCVAVVCVCVCHELVRRQQGFRWSVTLLLERAAHCNTLQHIATPY